MYLLRKACGEDGILGTRILSKCSDAAVRHMKVDNAVRLLQCIYNRNEMVVW